jgi:hypothetical protein
MSMRGSWLLLSALVGCTGWNLPQSGSVCAQSGEIESAVVTRATFARQLDDDTAEGLNLDGYVTEEGDVAGCFKGDFVGPNGEPGIDNQLATLLPLIEGFVGTENIDALLEGAIANGQLLIMVSLTGVDDVWQDDCVDVRVGAGLGAPFLDTEGSYVPYQTFAFDDEKPPSELLNGRIVDGVVVAGPGKLVLPVNILDARFDLDLRSAGVSLRITDDPIGGGLSLKGVVGGGILVDDFNGIITSLNIGDDVMGAVVPLVAGLADLGEDADGVCQRVSAALKFESTQAFLLENP